VTTTTASPAKRILVVEDDPLTSDMYARMLRLEGYRVRTAPSAEIGLQEVDADHPDAILLDLRMKDIDGLGFLRRLRRRHDSRHTPVAIVTGDYFVNDAVLEDLLRLDAHVCYKPLWLDDMVALIRELVGHQQIEAGC
jgi:DNA-binding response OmpR family regulator